MKLRNEKFQKSNHRQNQQPKPTTSTSKPKLLGGLIARVIGSNGLPVPTSYFNPSEEDLPNLSSDKSLPY
eukprot:Awhi_evm1s686